MVKHLPDHPVVKGSSPATAGPGGETMKKVVKCSNRKTDWKRKRERMKMVTCYSLWLRSSLDKQRWHNGRTLAFSSCGQVFKSCYCWYRGWDNFEICESLKEIDRLKEEERKNQMQTCCFLLLRSSLDKQWCHNGQTLALSSCGQGFESCYCWNRGRDNFKSCESLKQIGRLKEEERKNENVNMLFPLIKVFPGQAVVAQWSNTRLIILWSRVQVLLLLVQGRNNGESCERLKQIDGLKEE